MTKIRIANDTGDRSEFLLAAPGDMALTDATFDTHISGLLDGLRPLVTSKLKAGDWADDIREAFVSVRLDPQEFRDICAARGWELVQP